MGVGLMLKKDNKLPLLVRIVPHPRIHLIVYCTDIALRFARLHKRTESGEMSIFIDCLSKIYMRKVLHSGLLLLLQ